MKKLNYFIFFIFFCFSCENNHKSKIKNDVSLHLYINEDKDINKGSSNMIVIENNLDSFITFEFNNNRLYIDQLTHEFAGIGWYRDYRWVNKPYTIDTIFPNQSKTYRTVISRDFDSVILVFDYKYQNKNLSKKYLATKFGDKIVKTMLLKDTIW
jgi:hypothetical protein